MDEELALHMAMTVVGAPLVAVDLAEVYAGGTFSAHATVALFVVLLAAVSLVRTYRQPYAHLPTAVVHRRSRANG
jgi:hypothetical protein